jgi:hypothetical protein
VLFLLRVHIGNDVFELLEGELFGRLELDEGFYWLLLLLREN